MIENFKIVIPARRNSKGLPFKNRKLFPITLLNIPEKYHKNIIVTTDDEIIIDYCKVSGIDFHFRPEHLSNDEASTKDVMLDLIDKKINFNDRVIMLYLTYPERTWSDIERSVSTYIEKKVKSLLCKKEFNSTHPYLLMLELDENKGRQLIEHDLYRRQDYPKVFEISHFISIFDVSELNNLNKNLYNEDTFFLPIENKIDVDYESDLIKYNNGSFHKKE